MKINKLNAALAALGLVSLATVAQAQTTIYLTGSTACRATVFNAMQAGLILSGESIASPAPNNTSGANNIAYQGTLSGVGSVVVVCAWTGSEAGLASVAGATLTQDLPSDPNNTAHGSDTYALPGVPPSFLTAASGYTTTAPLGAGVNPDLSFADTSVNVSQTHFTPSTALTPYGLVGIVTFTWEKCFEVSSNSDTVWQHVQNITTPEANICLQNGDIINASVVTGVAADSSKGIAICGRNKGSGTRANCFLNSGDLGIGSAVQQFGYGTLANLYPSGTPGTLTFGNGLSGAAQYGSGQALQNVGNDGYDSGSGVQKTLNVDGSGNSVDLLIGYLGLSDAANSVTNVPSGGGAATPIRFNGVYEGDTAVEQGSYTYWGQERLYGQHGQSSTGAAATLAAALKSGVSNELTATGAGTIPGDVSSNIGQSPIIPYTSMLVSRAADAGYPVQAAFGGAELTY